MASILIDPDDTLQVAFDSGGVRLLEAGTDVLVKVPRVASFMRDAIAAFIDHDDEAAAEVLAELGFRKVPTVTDGFTPTHRVALAPGTADEITLGVFIDPADDENAPPTSQAAMIRAAATARETYDSCSAIVTEAKTGVKTLVTNADIKDWWA